ncbi:MAG: hypothetical protein R3F56_10820 [Planctomycetota bacterium]
MIRSFLSSLAAVSIAALTPPVPAQDAPAKPATQKPAAAKPAWPKLERLQIDRIDQLLQNFRLDNPELHEKSVDELVAMGAGAAPILCGRLSDAKTNANGFIVRVLDRVTAKEHTPLIAKDVAAKVTARRCWAAGRLVELEAENVAEPLRKCLADKDDEVAYRGAVGLAARGDVAGMDKVFARVKADWNGARAWLEPVLRKNRTPEVSGWLTTKLLSEEYTDKVAALRLFRSAGVREHAGKVARELDSSDNVVKKEAINALRVVVLDEPALDDLSVFQSIEMAKQIKSKL